MSEAQSWTAGRSYAPEAPLRYLCEIRLGKMLQPTQGQDTDRLVPYLKAGLVHWGRHEHQYLPEMWASPVEIANYAVRSGDVLVCEGGEVGRSAIVWTVPDSTIIQNSLHRLRSEDVDHRYLYYTLNAIASSGWLDIVTNKATIAHLTVEKLGSLRIPTRPLPDQRRIADFLDRETAHIDALTDKKRRLLDLLEEKRTALITQAVTKGLDPTVPTKDSGVEWQGEVPIHWAQHRLKEVLAERNQRSVDGIGELLTVSHIDGIRRRSESPGVTMFLAESLVDYKKCEPGDLVVNTMWAWMGGAGVATETGLVSPGYHVYRLQRTLLDPSFLEVLIRSSLFVQEMKRHSSGVWSSRLRLYPDVLLSLRCALPPTPEQITIAHEIGRRTKSITALRNRLSRQLEVIAEYRHTLITAAVTGELEIAEFNGEENLEARVS